MDIMVGFINKSDTNIITFNEIRPGSVILDLSMDSSANSGTQTFATEYDTLTTALSSGSLGGVPILSSSIAVANNYSIGNL